MKIKNPALVAYLNDLVESLEFSKIVPLSYLESDEESGKHEGAMTFKLINNMRSPKRTEFNMSLAIKADMEQFGLQPQPDDSPNLIIPDFFGDLGMDEEEFDEQDPNDFLKAVIATTKMIMEKYPELRTTSSFSKQHIDVISNFIVVGYDYNKKG